MNSAQATYPHAAGFKGDKSTGREAAAAVNQTLGARHAAVMLAVRNFGAVGCIPEQVANNLALPVHLLRPRFSELEKRGKLFAVAKRMGGLGKRVTAYSTVKPPVVGGEADQQSLLI